MDEDCGQGMPGSASWHDLVLTRGLVVDGTGSPGVPGDIGITSRRIADVGPAGSLKGTEEIDASGCVISPGFFDIHSHADFTIMLDGHAESALLQGVTSIVSGNCGYGIAPLGTSSREEVSAHVIGWRHEDKPRADWRTFGEYLQALRGTGVGVNVFPLLAHGPLRLSVVGSTPRPATPAENADMAAAAREAMQTGAVGFSSGLEYEPGTSATAEEFIAISKAVGGYGGMYATHCRNRDDRIADAAAEAIRVAEAGGCRLQLSHFLPRPAFAAHDSYQEALDLCRSSPAEVLFDVFPFDHGPTPLSALLPGWARRGTRAQVAERLADRRAQPKIVQDMGGRFQKAARAGIVADMYIASDGKDGSLTGTTLGALGRGEPVAETLVHLLARAGQNYADVTVAERWATWEDLERALASEDYLIMGDGVTATLARAHSGRCFSLSDWGYAPTMLATFVRDRGLVPLERAIHRMTMAPARQSGVRDRGVIAPGYAADLCVFDLTKLSASADPRRLCEPPAGIREVIVNGRRAVTSGRLTGALAGQVGLTR
jgi:N-acyl-D-amino-acid deacylase